MAKRETRAAPEEGLWSQAICGHKEALKHLGQGHTGRQSKDTQHNKGTVVLPSLRAAVTLQGPQSPPLPAALVSDYTHTQSNKLGLTILPPSSKSVKKSDLEMETRFHEELNKTEKMFLSAFSSR